MDERVRLITFSLRRQIANEESLSPPALSIADSVVVAAVDVNSRPFTQGAQSGG